VDSCKKNLPFFEGIINGRGIFFTATMHLLGQGSESIPRVNAGRMPIAPKKLQRIVSNLFGLLELIFAR
jgi:hypothetical protein